MTRVFCNENQVKGVLIELINDGIIRADLLGTDNQ